MVKAIQLISKPTPIFLNVVANNKKDKDADFVKDVLAFANTIRDESAYIIIGVTERDGSYVPTGIDSSESVDNALLQGKIKDKVLPIPHFRCYPYVNPEGLRFDIIEIPVTHYSAPLVSTVTLSHGLEKNQVYIRRDSSNERATSDEIVRLQAWLDSLPKLAQLNSRKKRTNNVGGFQFDEETIQKLFGNEAAEDEDIERLKQYYFKNDTFNKISVNLPLRILVGHKGIGKSALFKVAISEDYEQGIIPILIKPNDVSKIAKETQDFNSLIENWKEGLYSIIVRKVLAHFKIKQKIEIAVTDDNLMEGLLPVFEDVLDSESLNKSDSDVVARFLETQHVNVYIDDLDRGWLGGKTDINRLSALLNAVRDITNANRGFKFRISLRSDVYFLIRTSDESTDKIQSSVIWYRWTQHEILCLLAKRVMTFFNKDVNETLLRSQHQADIATNLNQIIEPIFAGRGKWQDKPMYKVLLSVIRKRPRDLVKLLTLAARHAHNRGSNYIRSADMQAVFDEYSLDRIQDTINEYKSELPQIERLIFGMKPDKRNLHGSSNFYYSTAELLSKLSRLRERSSLYFFSGREPDAKELAAFLYKINFLTATKKREDGFIERKDFEENRYLVPKFEDFGYDWEVHMAYRWGLQPSQQDDIFSEF